MVVGDREREREMNECGAGGWTDRQRHIDNNSETDTLKKETDKREKIDRVKTQSHRRRHNTNTTADSAFQQRPKT